MSNTSLVLEICSLSDVKRLADFSRKTFSDAFEEQNNPEDYITYSNNAFSVFRLSDELKNPLSTFYFCHCNGQLAGYLKLNDGEAQSDIKDEDALEIERIYVLKEFQGKGIGKWLVEQTKQKAKELKKAYVWLGVWEENKAAIRFYVREGFTKFATHPYPIGNDVQTDWLMKCMV